MANKKRFAVSAGLGYAVLAALVIVMMTSGVALAFPIAGVGGFVVAGDRITGQNFHLYPHIGETSELPLYPMAAIDLDSVTIKGLKLSKQLGAMGINVEVTISAAGDVTGTNVKMKVSGLTADRAVLENLDQREHYSTNVLEKIDMRATSVDMKNAQLNTHSMYVGSITIPGMGLSIKFIQ